VSRDGGRTWTDMPMGGQSIPASLTAPVPAAGIADHVWTTFEIAALLD
jgi:hypothetical protein